MKKKITIAGLLLAMMLVLTGCSWEDIKSKFVGSEETETSETATGGAIEIEEYNVDECVTLATYKGVEVDCVATDDEVQDEIDSLIFSNMKEKKIKKGKCKSGQSVSIDYVGKVDGKKFDNGSAEDQVITLGSSGYIDGFDDGVIGMKVGQTKDLNLQFPDTYHAADLAGKKCVFTVTLNYIVKQIEPEFDDAFVKKNTDYKTVKAFKAGTKKEITASKKASASATAMADIELKSTYHKIPETMKLYYRNQLDCYYHYTATSYGFTDFNTFLTQVGMTAETYEQQLDSGAETLCKTHLVTEAIAKAENLTVTDDEIKKTISDIVTSSGTDEESLRKEFTSIYGETTTMEEYYYQNLLNQKVLDVVGKNAKIIE